MMRIGVQEESTSTTLTIEGKLTARSAIELERCWREAVAAQPLRAIVVNLAAVAYVDPESRALLTRMRRDGVKLVPTGCLMKVIVDQIEAEVTRDGARL